jgi:hypothetical protein
MNTDIMARSVFVTELFVNYGSSSGSIVIFTLQHNICVRCLGEGEVGGSSCLFRVTASTTM